MTDIRIGTSGWHYKHWIGRYYPEDIKPAAMLAHYLRDFDTVELNNTFYHLPKEESFDAWRDATPRDFLFAVKGSRFLTHLIKLKDPSAVSSTSSRARNASARSSVRSSGSSRLAGTSTSSGSKSSCSDCRPSIATRSSCATKRG
ncbi:MAG: hypothetical protein QOI24_2515 [Acidobacteriota bacterium]|jgi:uncharacterized protein YecE (DUF72 family)|nr:hypothetical protein [Acidobacteriota bacterium]